MQITRSQKHQSHQSLGNTDAAGPVGTGSLPTLAAEDQFQWSLFDDKYMVLLNLLWTSLLVLH